MGRGVKAAQRGQNVPGGPHRAAVTSLPLMSPAVGLVSPPRAGVTPFIPDVTPLVPRVTHYKAGVTHHRASITLVSPPRPCCHPLRRGLASPPYCWQRHSLVPSLTHCGTGVIPGVTPSSPASPRVPSITSCPQHHPLVPTTPPLPPHPSQ